MKLVIKKTHTGKRVFAGQAIKKDEVIIEMSGPKMLWSKIEALILAGALNADDPFQIAEDRFILLDPTPRYFNHSCDPNTGIKEGNMLVALREIKKGEEITYDYSSVVCAHCDWRMHCACGSNVCRKVIKNARSIPKKQLQKYIELGVLPRFIKKELTRA